MVEDIYVGEFYVGSEYIRYAWAAPSVPTATRPVATALRCWLPLPPAALATGYRYQLAVHPPHALLESKGNQTGCGRSKVIDTYYSEHTKLNLVDTQ